MDFLLSYMSLFSSVVEHWSRKPGVVSSILTGGNGYFFLYPIIFPGITLEQKT